MKAEEAEKLIITELSKVKDARLTLAKECLALANIEEEKIFWKSHPVKIEQEFLQDVAAVPEDIKMDRRALLSGVAAFFMAQSEKRLKTRCTSNLKESLWQISIKLENLGKAILDDLGLENYTPQISELASRYSVNQTISGLDKKFKILFASQDEDVKNYIRGAMNLMAEGIDLKKAVGRLNQEISHEEIRKKIYEGYEKKIIFGNKQLALGEELHNLAQRNKAKFKDLTTDDGWVVMSSAGKHSDKEITRQAQRNASSAAI